MKFKASDLVNRLLLAGLGLAALTQEKAKKLVEDLLAKEGVSKGETAAFVGELVKRGKKTQKKLGDLVKKEVAGILSKVDFASKKDIAQLEKRIRKLEAKRTKRTKRTKRR
jgi:polyhydroxyalkanoate synthesis regulator phasin